MRKLPETTSAYARSLVLMCIALTPVAAMGANLAPTIATDEIASPGAGCSLREAVIQANTNLVVDAACGPAGEDGATDTITLAAGTTYSLTLAGAEDASAGGDLDLLDNAAPLDLVITGSGSTIRNASIPKDRVLQILEGANVSISGVTIRDGVAAGTPGPPEIANSGRGGGILNLGSLTMTDCVVVDNLAVGPAGVNGVALGQGGIAFGGGIAAFGPLSLTDCEVRLNKAIGGEGASPVLDSDGSVGGYSLGGGLYQTGPPVNLLRVRFEANEAQGGAPGTGGPLPARVSFAAGGAACCFGFDVTDSVFQGNVAVGSRGGSVTSGQGGAGGQGEGGALALFGGQQSIFRSTFSSNQARGGEGGQGDAGLGFKGLGYGGAIFKLTSLLNISNSTISGNAALLGEVGAQGSDVAAGGGIFVSIGGVFLDSVTLTGSTADGIHSDGQVSATNSIIALQASGADCVGETFISADYNIDSDGTCNFGQPHDQPGTPSWELGLKPLADNGGITETHAITAGLAAYNRGSTVLLTDQRGVTRPQWLAADIGAFEQEGGVSTIEIPALSRTGLVLVAALLALVAILALRRTGD